MFRKKLDNVVSYRILQSGTYDDIVKLLLVHDKIHDPNGYLMKLDKYSKVILEFLERGEISEDQLEDLNVGPIYFLVRSFLRHHGFRKHGIFTLGALKALNMKEVIIKDKLDPLGEGGSLYEYEQKERLESMKFYLDLFSSQFNTLLQTDERIAQEVKQLLEDVSLLYKHELIFTHPWKKRNNEEEKLFSTLASTDFKDPKVRSILKKSGIAFTLEVCELSNLILGGLTRGYSLFYPKRYIPYFDYKLSRRLKSSQKVPNAMIQKELFSICIPDWRPISLRKLIKIRSCRELRNLRREIQKQSQKLLEDIDSFKTNDFKNYLKDNYEKQLAEFVYRRMPEPEKFLFKELISDALPFLKWILRANSLSVELRDKKDFALLTSSVKAQRVMQKR